MKFFDINCSLGGWPFRTVPRHTAALVRADLKRLGCSGALAVNNGGVLYSDTAEANRELASWIAPYRDFFCAAATLDPRLPQAAEELTYFVRHEDFRALRLLPAYHRYDADDPAAVKLAQLAGELGIPVLLPAEIVNFRQRHFLEPEAPQPWDEALKLIRAVPGANFIRLDAPLPAEATELPNLYGEFNRGGGLYYGWLQERAAGVGGAKLLFGTGAPLRSPEAALLKLHHLDVPAEVKERIAAGNAGTLKLVP